MLIYSRYKEDRMHTFGQDLISLVERREITFKDAILIVLARDGLKPLATVGVETSLELKKFLTNYNIAFSEKDGRIFIGYLATDTLFSIRIDGDTFGFPSCCSSVFFDHGSCLKNGKSSFSSLSAYIFHIPCSDNCNETKQLAEKYMNYVKCNYPEIAQTVEIII